MSTTNTSPYLDCACERQVSLGGKRVGDSVECPGCFKLNVVTRSNAKGDVPPAVRFGGLAAEERQEVAEVLHRIKRRRVGQAARHVLLYPSWAVFAAGVQFYLSAILAGQNLIAQGEVARGKRLRLIGIVSYVALGGVMLGLGFTLDSVPLTVKAGVAMLVPLCFAGWLTWVQHTRCAAARDAGAGSAPVLLPLLFGLILAIAQAFAIWFVKLRFDGPFMN